MKRVSLSSDSMDDICICDFVANYDWQDRDIVHRKYAKLKKSPLPNYKLFDLRKENQGENYFYSLILLFVPFRDEGSLLLENEMSGGLMNENSSAYYVKLQKILGALSKVREFNKARHGKEGL